MELLNRFIENIHKHYLFTKKDRLLLAVSGGVDSMALTGLCKKAGFDFGIAHCNFQLRGTASDADEAFVKAWAGKWAVPFYSIRFNTGSFAAENRLSVQEAARVLRYEWFEELRSRNGFDYILTAHHANDTIETLLMNFFRGTGMNGLTGIKEQNGVIVRPLLFAKRTELEAFLEQEGLSFVQDESNLKNDYTRNFIRNELLPQIARVYPEVEQNLIANIDRFKEATRLYQRSVEQYKKKLLLVKGAEIHLPVLLLLKSAAPSTVLFELIKEYGFSAAQVPEIMRLTESGSGHYIVSATHRVIRDRRHLILAPLQAVENARVLIEQPGRFPFKEGVLAVKQLQLEDHRIPTDPGTAWLDAAEIRFPLILRPWKTGDYFYPLGMTKKKKISRFLIDKKLSLIQKEAVWVVETDRKIIWVAGQRMDNRFKVTERTKQIIELRFLKS
ncbi:tRNA lysidine(34) synthetase TilS [Niabella ginsenosidivorans]|uniref:tRNA(Ile)-lysidine synthase n=1 Tax=Niabella ginsenosidivorans TaxID=1176587 RepID=A0A1A9I2U7_9BACT|nr:tRNA lysidine(34) synthetase TilS [Niabella ginsenosidivorans]ANH81002.1 tRNA lysidine(34) synthetase TilS [Niabella ginsenosidivorans]